MIGRKSNNYGRHYKIKDTSRYGKSRIGKKRPPFSDEWKKKLASYKGSLASNWKGGLSFLEYPQEFSDELKEEIRLRDGFRCQECFRHQGELRTSTNKPYKLNIHHIDYNKKNCESSNLISLCRSCHLQTNFKRTDWEKYFKNRYEKSKIN